MAALLTLRFPRWLAFTLLGLFAVQYALPGQGARYLLCAIYGGIALVALIRNRRYILAALTAPFRALPRPSKEPEPADRGPELPGGALLTMRFPRWLAFTLLGLFAVQYALPGQGARYLLCAIYGGIALVALIRNRRYILPALTAPFRSPPRPSREPEPATAIALGPRIEQIERIDQDDEDGRLSDRPADASAAAAGYSPPRTRS